jgi:RNA polymerase sigma factor (sigma-70 family)
MNGFLAVRCERENVHVLCGQGDMASTTNTALLAGLRDPQDDVVWREFCERYRPVLVSFASRLGLGRPEAEDAAQETLLAFATSYRQGHYDREKGRLRSWLSGIAQNKIRDIQRRRQREAAIGDGKETTAFVERFPDPHSLSEVWEAEWRRALVRACLERVRSQVEPTTIRAFELFALREWPAEEVASHLGLSRNAVYKAKNHVLSRLRSMRKDLEGSW